MFLQPLLPNFDGLIRLHRCCSVAPRLRNAAKTVERPHGRPGSSCPLPILLQNLGGTPLQEAAHDTSYPRCWSLLSCRSRDSLVLSRCFRASILRTTNVMLWMVAPFHNQHTSTASRKRYLHFNLRELLPESALPAPRPGPVRPLGVFAELDVPLLGRSLPLGSGACGGK